MFEGCTDDFHYANQGQSPVIDGVDDAKDMCNTRRAFSLLGECFMLHVSGLPFVINHHLLF